MKQNKQHAYAGNSQQNSQGKTATHDPIGENIETIADMHKHAEHRVNPQQRAIEKVTAFLGRPRFLYIILISVTLWILVNALLPKVGIPNFDPPPFYWLQAILSVGTIFMTTVILITQQREDKETERRTQLDLHIGLLVEQKISKLIELIEELREDTPSVKNRHDPQAEAMQASTDPHQVLSTLNELLRENKEAVEGEA